MAFNAQQIALHAYDPDLLWSVVTDCEFEHRLLHGGRFGANLRRIHLPNSRIDYGVYSLPCFARGELPRDRVTIGYTHSVKIPGWVNGHSVGCNELQVYPEGSEIHYRTSPSAPWCTIQVDRERLQNHAIGRTGTELKIPFRGCLNVQTVPAAFDALCQVIEMAASLPSELIDDADLSGIHRIEANLLDILVHALAGPSSTPTARKIPERKHRRVRRLERVLDECLKHPELLKSLTRRTGVNERTLQRLAKEVYRMTPKQLHRVTKLNLIHRELLHSEPSQKAVVHVAEKFAVTHHGRFASHYRELFNEYPHETLQRLNRG